MISSCVRSLRASRHAAPMFKRSYFTQTFNDKDKFSKDLKDYPTIVEGLEGQLAKELFRHAYNTDQLGYFKVALEYVDTLGAQHRFVEKEFQEDLKKAGVPETIGTEFLTNVYESMLADSYSEIVTSYNDLYNAHYRVTPGTITVGQYYPPKYASYLRKVREIGAPTLAKGKRVEWDVKLFPQDLSGWRAIAESQSIDNSGASALEKDRTEGIEGVLA